MRDAGPRQVPAIPADRLANGHSSRYRHRHSSCRHERVVRLSAPQRRCPALPRIPAAAVLPEGVSLREENLSLRAKYNITALFYDLLDYPWERVYRNWRPRLLGELRGRVLEAGVGTGRNFEHYHESVELTGIDLSDIMLKKAARRASKASCSIELLHDDASVMHRVESGRYDWIISTFLCCVMPDEFQPMALEQFARVLKPGGRFRLLEMVYSDNRKIRRRQEFFAPFVEKVYGARFDRNTIQHIENNPALGITATRFLKDDVYLLVDGIRKVQGTSGSIVIARNAVTKQSPTD